MDVNIGKGITLEVDDAALPANVIQHVVYIGLRNILMDAHASVTHESDGADYQANAKAVAEKKLAALMAGELRVAGTRSRESDPVRAEAVKIAGDKVKAAWRAAGHKLDALTKEAKAKYVEALLVKDPAILALAQTRVTEAKAVGAVDLGDLLA